MGLRNVRGHPHISCCSLLSILLLRSGPAASAGGHRSVGIFSETFGCASAAHILGEGAGGTFVQKGGGGMAARMPPAVAHRVLGAFVPACLEGPGVLHTHMRRILLRGGCEGPIRNKPAQCSFCTKVHAVGDRCKVENTMALRAAVGRRTSDGWALLSTARGAASCAASDAAAEVPYNRDEKVGQPKGLSEYGWGETAYAQSSSAKTVIGKQWVGDFCVLGIETSCDDTAAAVVHSNGTILGESKRTQDELHAKWGGVVPGLARDAHQQAIELVVEEALSQASMTPKDIDAVAVTMGPGLEICLRVGFTKARDIALEFQRPFVSVHHLEAHVLTVRQSDPSIKFPFLVLLVSGGHCQLLVAVAVGDYKMLGGTLDDSLGTSLVTYASPSLTYARVQVTWGSAYKALLRASDY